jgi:hypothetical protein
VKTQDAQRSYLTFIRTLLARVKGNNITDAEDVPIPPHADVTADLLLQRVMSRAVQDRLAEEFRPDKQVLRRGGCHGSLLRCLSGDGWKG